jgi:hypothetical protein
MLMLMHRYQDLAIRLSLKTAFPFFDGLIFSSYFQMIKYEVDFLRNFFVSFEDFALFELVCALCLERKAA